MTERMTNADQLRALRKFSEGQLRWDEVEALTEALRALEQEPQLKAELEDERKAHAQTLAACENERELRSQAELDIDSLACGLAQAEAELTRLRADLQAKK